MGPFAARPYRWTHRALSRKGQFLICWSERTGAGDSRGFVLAIRKDVLGRGDVADDATVFAVRELLHNFSYAVFQWRWGERGRFGSTLVDNGLDWTGSGAVLLWAKGHRRAHVASFRWRRSMRL